MSGPMTISPDRIAELRALLEATWSWQTKDERDAAFAALGEAAIAVLPALLDALSPPGGDVREAVARMEKRAEEIEVHVKRTWGGDGEGAKWWPEAIQLAKDIRLSELEKALRPITEWARLEELHGSTIGHEDIPDETTVIVKTGSLQVVVGTVSDFRRALSAIEGG